MENSGILKAVFEHAPDGIVVIDQAGIIRMANPALCSLFGYLPDELVRQNISALLQPEPGHPGALAFIRQSADLAGRTKAGLTFPLEISISEFKYARHSLYVCTFHDLRREKETEYSLSREKQLNHIKTRLVSTASHEFRSPLSRIQLSAALIQRYYQRMDQDKIMDHLKKIKLAVDDMTDTLDDFLSIERIEAGNMQPDYKPFDLVILAEELTEQIRQQAKPGVHIVYRHAGDDSVVFLDRTMLRHCLVNLLSNALKYSNDNGLIEFETALTDKKCTVIVRDHGIGIPAKDQPHLFEAFFRAGNTTGIQGTGLGLNIVKNYVGLMGGTITCSSRENKGTNFTLNFKASATK